MAEMTRPEATSLRNPTMLMIVIEFGLVSILLLAEPLAAIFYISDSTMLNVWCWFFVVSSVWMLGSWRILRGSLFMPFPVFLMAGIVFNGGQLVLTALHLNGEPILASGSFGDKLLVRTASYVTFGLLSFHAGGLVARRIPVPAIERALGEETDVYTTMAMAIVGVLLFCIGLPFYISEKLTEIHIVLRGNYLALYQQHVGVGVASAGGILAGACFAGLMFMLAGFHQSRVWILIVVSCVLAMSVTDLALGYRAYAIWPVIAMVWLLQMLGIRMPRSMMITASAFTVFVVFPLVRAIRDIKRSARFDIDSWWNLYWGKENPATGIIREMGGSMITVAYTLKLVPSQRGFDMGLGYLYAVSTLVPNIFGNGAHPLVRHGTPSRWLVEEVDPAFAALGGGLGYSFIAEAYYNFGWMLGLVALFVLGYGMASFFWWCMRWSGVVGIVFAAIGLSFLSHFARGEINSVLRPVVWYALLPALAVRLCAETLRERGDHRRLMAMSVEDDSS